MKSFIVNTPNSCYITTAECACCIKTMPGLQIVTCQLLNHIQMMRVLYCVLLATIGCSAVPYNDCIGKHSVTAALGHPYFLTFNYDGPKEIVDYSFNKDGVVLNGDNTRIFPDMDRIYFTEVTELDAGTYTLELHSGEFLYNETIILCGEQA